MKYPKLLLLIVVILTSCVGPTISMPTQTLTLQPTSEIAATPIPMTPDPSMGSIQGSISWLDLNVPVKTVNIELNGHSGSKPLRYSMKTDVNGNYSFVNIEPMNYGFGIYFSIPISERHCDNPEFLYDKDLDWLHYTTWLKGDLWFDIIFSNKDVVVRPGETVVLNFSLKCP